ncbi:hypothetical protein [Hansschlegelia sp.]|uniref:hypothetical protein n=1 Tax=Hansschlegelia sp. TaxID=2041892 RepID=UPI002C1A2AE3|nr:hypothetical protein [Hansschlegelia sp.]HVI29907.1 hypothetical protein [Hansschlegelia sp.]
MKAFLIALVAAVAIGFVASVVLSGSQQLAYQKFATSGVRISEPGTNLVGHKWNGDPTPADFTNETREKAEDARADSKGS